MEIRTIIPLLLLVIACAGPQPVADPQGDWSWLDEEGKAVPDIPWRQSAGSLGAMLFFTADPEGLYERWAQPTPGVELRNTDVVSREKPVLITAVFYGCQPDSQGLCQLTVSYRITTVDGRELNSPEPVDMWLNKPPPGGDAQQLSAKGVMYSPELEDKGPIEVKAYVVDQVSGKRMLLIRKLNIEDSEAIAARPVAPAIVQGGYSTEPLAAAVFEYSEVTGATVVFNDWLKENYASLTPKTMPGPREHLYYLINSWVSYLYRGEGVVRPLQHDSVLQTFFTWSEPLGAYGGNLVYNAIKRESSAMMPPVLPVPSAYSLSVREDMFHLESKRGAWSVAFPYYFMIGNMKEYVANDGPRTQLVGVSTAGAVHQGVGGHSQATLMLLAGPGENPTAFEAYWTPLIGFAGNEPTRELPVGKLVSRSRYDASTRIHSEYVTLQAKSGAIVVWYSGVDGTYQWNRPHFIDFVRSLHSSLD